MQTIIADASSLKHLAKSLTPRVIYRDKDGDYIFLDEENKVELAINFEVSDPAFGNAKSIISYNDGTVELLPIVLTAKPVTEETVINYSRFERSIEPTYPVVAEDEN